MFRNHDGYITKSELLQSTKKLSEAQVIFTFFEEVTGGGVVGTKPLSEKKIVTVTPISRSRKKGVILVSLDQIYSDPLIIRPLS